MKRTTYQHPTITIIILFAIVASLVSFCTAPSISPHCPLQIMPFRTRATQGAARHRHDDKAMAAAILQKEKNTGKNDGLKAVNEDNLNVAVDTNPAHVPLPLVVSPPSAPNLTSLLTGHMGQEVGEQAANNGIAMDKGSNTQEDEQVDDSVKSPKKKKPEKIKSTKEDISNRSGSSLKKSSFAIYQAVAVTSSAKETQGQR
jgi:hypothetical protein